MLISIKDYAYKQQKILLGCYFGSDLLVVIILFTTVETSSI
jgi:hypothetical protein